MINTLDRLQAMVGDPAEIGMDVDEMQSVELHLRGLTVRQIAQAMGLALATAHRRLRSGRTKAECYRRDHERDEAGDREWLHHAIRADVQERVVRVVQRGDTEEYVVEDYWRPATLAHASSNLHAIKPKRSRERSKEKQPKEHNMLCGSKSLHTTP